MGRYGEGIYRGVREDGTVEGTVVETFILHPTHSRIDIEEPPYLAIVMDGPGIDYEVRLPADFVESMAEHFARAREEEPTP